MRSKNEEAARDEAIEKNNMSASRPLGIGSKAREARRGEAGGGRRGDGRPHHLAIGSIIVGGASCRSGLRRFKCTGRRLSAWRRHGGIKARRRREGIVVKPSAAAGRGGGDMTLTVTACVRSASFIGIGRLLAKCEAILMRAQAADASMSSERLRRRLATSSSSAAETALLRRGGCAAGPHRPMGRGRRPPFASAKISFCRAIISRPNKPAQRIRRAGKSTSHEMLAITLTK